MCVIRCCVACSRLEGLNFSGLCCAGMCKQQGLCHRLQVWLAYHVHGASTTASVVLSGCEVAGLNSSVQPRAHVRQASEVWKLYAAGINPCMVQSMLLGTLQPRCPLINHCTMLTETPEAARAEACNNYAQVHVWVPGKPNTHACSARCLLVQEVAVPQLQFPPLPTLLLLLGCLAAVITLCNHLQVQSCWQYPRHLQDQCVATRRQHSSSSSSHRNYCP